MGKLFYIMGKSATGKDHIYRALIADPSLALHPVVLYTTRPKRSGETDGIEYHFIDQETLGSLRDAGRIIEERMYRTVSGPWYYATVDDGRISLAQENYLTIGTLESWLKIRDYFGPDHVVPLYIETEDGLRLTHALRRERKQAHPNYAELCRRFLADTEDFSEEHLAAAGITRRISNNGTLEECISSVHNYILQFFE